MTLKEFDKVTISSYNVTVFEAKSLKAFKDGEFEFVEEWFNDWEVGKSFAEDLAARKVHQLHMEKYENSKVRFVNVNSITGFINVSVFVKTA